MSIPDLLAHQIEFFEETGRVAILDPEGFAEPSWASLLLGLGVMPRRRDPYVDLVDLDGVKRHLSTVRNLIRRTTQAMPLHTEFLARIAGG